MNTMLLIVLKAVATLAFVIAGGAKLMKEKSLVAQFHDFHLPLEIMCLIGVAEILGAIALWFDVLALWAFSGLAFLMIGAMKRHVQAKHPAVTLMPAAALFGICIGGVLLVQWLG